MSSIINPASIFATLLKLTLLFSKLIFGVPYLILPKFNLLGIVNQAVVAFIGLPSLSTYFCVILGSPQETRVF
jgi:hypothetical protein